MIQYLKSRPYIRNKWRDSHPEKTKEYRQRYKYGISPVEYDTLFQNQGGRCAICREESEKPLYVDHNHKTGEVRGLLCTKCNPALGLFNDSIIILENAINYLMRE
jgi:hypothetical protein